MYLPISILIKGQIFHTTALLDTGASHNFIDLRFTELAGWKFNPLAESASSVSGSFQSFNVTHPVEMISENFSFLEPFCTAKNMLFPVNLEIGWWEKYQVSVNYLQNTLKINHQSGTVTLQVNRTYCKKTASTAKIEPSPDPKIPFCLKDLKSKFEFTDTLPQHLV